MQRALGTLTLALATLVLPAHADLTWTLNGVTFDDGGTATGFVTFEQTGLITYSVSVSGGNTGTFPALTYAGTNAPTGLNTSGTAAGSAGSVFLFGPEQLVQPNSQYSFLVPRTFEIILATLSPTSGTGTPISVANSFECIGCNPFRTVTAGSVDVTGSITSWDLFLPPDHGVDPGLQAAVPEGSQPLSMAFAFGVALFLSGVRGLPPLRKRSVRELPSR